MEVDPSERACRRAGAPSHACGPIALGVCTGPAAGGRCSPGRTGSEAKTDDPAHHHPSRLPELRRLDDCQEAPGSLRSAGAPGGAPGRHGRQLAGCRREGRARCVAKLHQGQLWPCCRDRGGQRTAFHLPAHYRAAP
eukprot:8396339-Alexandrium_andersonii.AAC.1